MVFDVQCLHLSRAWVDAKLLTEVQISTFGMDAPGSEILKYIFFTLDAGGSPRWTQTPPAHSAAAVLAALSLNRPILHFQAASL